MAQITLALRTQAAGPFEPQWEEYRIDYDRSSAILLRHLLQVSGALLWFRSRFHRILGVSPSGHITIDKAPFSPPGLPPLFLTRGREIEPIGIGIDQVDFTGPR